MKVKLFVVTAIIIAGALIAGGLAWLSAQTSADVPTDRDIRTDGEAVAEWESVLGPALRDLDAVPSVPGLTRDGAATVRLCSVDSGELFDLSAGRTWDAPQDDTSDLSGDMKPTEQTGAGFMAIVDHLRGLGWRVTRTATATGSTTSANPDYDTAFLRRRSPGARVFVTVQVFDTGVVASLRFRGAPKACHLEE